MEEKKIIIDKWLEKKLTISIGKLFVIATLALLVFFVTKIGVRRSISISGNTEDGLEISSLIRKVKTELMKADTQRIKNNENALFALKEFSMEISFTVRSVNKGEAKVDYQIVTVEGGAETSNEKVQKLMLRWDAIPAKAEPLPLDTTSPDLIITPIDTAKKKLP